MPTSDSQVDVCLHAAESDLTDADASINSYLLSNNSQTQTKCLIVNKTNCAGTIKQKNKYKTKNNDIKVASRKYIQLKSTNKPTQ